MKSHVIKLAALILVFSMVLAACGQGNGSGEAVANGDANAAVTASDTAGSAGDITVVMANIGNILDPIVANSTAVNIMMYHVYDRLIQINDDLDVVGHVASSWSQPDNTTLEFIVQDGFTFHNGDPLTMDDIVFSIERTRELAHMATFSANLGPIEIDGNRLIVNMLEPNSSYIRDFASIVLVNQSQVEALGDDYANNPIGTGPFRVREFIPGTRLVIEAWPDHPFSVPALDSITFISIPEPVARYIALESGDVHFASIDSRDRDRATENPDVQLVEVATTFTAFVAMNSSVPPFDNVNIRRAMAHAFNREGIAALSPGQMPIDSMFPRMFSTYYSSAYTPEYSLELARELLEAEGYGPGNPLQFEGWVFSPDYQMPMEAFQAELRTIGVEMEIISLEFGVFLERLAAGESRLLMGGWNNTSGDPLSAFEVYYSGTMGTMNIGFYENPRTDELFYIARATTSQEELMEAAREVQNIAAQNVPILPIYSHFVYYSFANELRGVEMLTNAMICFRNAYLY